MTWQKQFAIGIFRSKAIVSRAPVVTWHDPAHELIEQWHREGGVTMTWA
jgi:hypothetical protein